MIESDDTPDTIVFYDYFIISLFDHSSAYKGLRTEYFWRKTLISLIPITEDNFIEAFNLKLAKGQEEYVSHPIRSLAQAYVYRNQCQPFGIYADEKMVGYVMVIYDYDIPEYDIWHMMIDEKYQHRGYGQKAMEKCL